MPAVLAAARREPTGATQGVVGAGQSEPLMLVSDCRDWGETVAVGATMALP